MAPEPVLNAPADTLKRVGDEHFQHLYPHIRARIRSQRLGSSARRELISPRWRVHKWNKTSHPGWRSTRAAGRRQKTGACAAASQASSEHLRERPTFSQPSSSSGRRDPLLRGAHCCAAYKDPQPSNQSQTRPALHADRKQSTRQRPRSRMAALAQGRRGRKDQKSFIWQYATARVLRTFQSTATPLWSRGA